MNDTVLDRVVACLRAALAFDPNVRVAPAALLWPDEGAQWERVMARLGEHLPIVSLGDFDHDARIGPGYWIRCIVAETIDAELLDGQPIVYLPGVSRSTLRAADTCPPALAPIFELQYRSQWFSHRNNRDWTVRALLSHPAPGPGLRIADDADTSSALSLALDRLLYERLDRLSNQVLDADYLLELINEDPVRSLLRWLDDPRGYRAAAEDVHWAAFVRQSKADYDFDPTVAGEVSAAHKLGSRHGRWASVWKRFAETPDRYPGVVDQLRKARPDVLFDENVDSWPQDNEMAEDQLRNQLRDFDVLTADGATSAVNRLDGEHARRRSTVWAALDKAPLAFALEQLVVLGELTKQPLADGNLDTLVDDYAERGWRADDAVLLALAAATAGPDRQAVSAAVGALYRNWLDAGAKALQRTIGPLVNARTYKPGSPASTAPGTVTLFVDGLRLDIARRLQERLAGAGLEVVATTSLSALPTVTQTAKAALIPTAPGALGAGPDLHPTNVTTGTKASIQVLRTLMSDIGIQVLGPTHTGDPTGAAWAEAGEIDHRGHDVGIRLVEHLDAEVGRIADRIRELLDAGWQRVNVLTDHGWMLLPGGMEKVDLLPATTDVKKGRCARLKDGAAVDMPTVPWFWDPDVRIALAPGATCFEANKEYEHGGVSPQECIVPRLTVTAGAAPTLGGAEFTKVKWLGLQCRAEFTGVSGRVVIDLRGLPGDPRSSIAERVKETAMAGKVSLVVPDEEHEGETVHLVLVAEDGQILAQREVVVGRNR